MSQSLRGNNITSSNNEAHKLYDSLDHNFSNHSIFKDGVSHEVDMGMQDQITLSEIPTHIFDPSCINGAVENKTLIAP